mmetsp:Transcript_1945/g.6800  ORF Transcript_1945/g.6800 Transcript_1945/m.6800 type:complete len:456 (-) Transcript_1945:198-1565(-)
MGFGGRRRKGPLGWIRFQNPITAKISQMKKQIVSAAATFTLSLAFFSVVKGRAFKIMKMRAELARDRKIRAKRLNKVRLKLAGPLRSAAEELLKRIDDILDNTSNGYFMLNSEPGAVDVSVLSTVYVFCSYFFWRFELEAMLQFEMVEQESDHWQYTVDNCLEEVSEAFSCAVHPKKGFSMATYNMKAKENDTWKGYRGEAFPFRLSQYQRQAISELMKDRDYVPPPPPDYMQKKQKAKKDENEDDEHDYTSPVPDHVPITFTQFCRKIKRAEDEARRFKIPIAAPKKSLLPIPGSQMIVGGITKVVPFKKEREEDGELRSEWLEWIGPLIRDVKHYRSLTLEYQSLSVMEPAKLRDLVQQRNRLKLIRSELNDLVFILNRNPNDPYFRTKHDIDIDEAGNVIETTKDKEKKRRQLRQNTLGRAHSFVIEKMKEKDKKKRKKFKRTLSVRVRRFD